MTKKLQIVHIAGLAACAIAAVVIALNAPSSSTREDIFALAINEALDSWELNNGNAEGAPQQQVVNGWAAKDLLEIQTRQTNDLLALTTDKDERGPHLLALLIVTVVWIGAWQTATRYRTSGTPTTAGSDPDPWITTE